MKSCNAFVLAAVVAILGAFLTIENVACSVFGLREVDVRFIASPSDGGSDAVCEVVR